jgi:PAS domain S-box-containing protein
MLGYSSAELLGMPFQDVTHPQDLQGEMDAIADLLAGGSEQVTIEKRYIRKDGQQFWGAMSLGLTRERDGAPLHFMAIVEDISQRKLTETRLRESEDRFRKLFETAPLPRYLIDPADGSISDCNPAAAAMLEYSRSELRGMKIADIAPVLTGARLQSRQSMLDGEPVKFESRHRTRSGKFRDVVVSAVPVNISGCRMAHCTVVDITERKTAEAELRRLTTDLEERVREEVAARETAQVRAARAERLQALGQLAGGIAHDFNNILQAVQGGGSIIENRAGDADTVRRYARLVIEAAERGASITRRLLAFGRRGNLLAQPLQACSILEGMRAILEPTLGAAIKVVVDVRPGLLTLLADKGQLETALVNLAVNARDAMPGGGVLTLGARASSGVHQEGVLAAGRYVSITVTDTGTGMDKATLARVFEPFFTTKPQGRGTGLGLATVKGFAEQSGGAVAVESVAGRGTAVTLWLPQAPEQDGAPDPAADTAEGSGAGAARRRVLVVDDDPLVLATLAGELEHEGFVVTAAAGGATALAALDGGLKVDAVISDLSMPDLDGLTFIREAQARLPGLPAVLLTGYVEERADLTLASKARRRSPESTVRSKLAEIGRHSACPASPLIFCT